MMTERLKRLEVTPGAASEVQQHERRRRLDVLQQRGDVLAHVVIARAFPVGLRALVVVCQRSCGDSVQVLGCQLHARPGVVEENKPEFTRSALISGKTVAIRAAPGNLGRVCGTVLAWIFCPPLNNGLLSP